MEKKKNGWCYYKNVYTSKNKIDGGVGAQWIYIFV